MKIVGIATREAHIDHIYRVGEVLGFMGDLTVDKITYHRAGTLYNKGFQTNEAGYSVAFVDSKIRHLIPEREVIQVSVDITKEKKSTESAAAEETPDDFLLTEENTEEVTEGA